MDTFYELQLHFQRFSVNNHKGRKLVGPLTLKVNPGEVVAVIGPSLSGKTALLDSIAGTLRKCSVEGELLANGQRRDEKWSTLCGYVTDNDTLPKYTTVFEHLLSLAQLRLQSITRRRRSQKIQDLLVLFCIEGLSSTPIVDLSPADRLRVQTCAELITEPGMLLVDSFDREAHAVTDILCTLCDLAKNYRKTIFLSYKSISDSHLNLCDTVILLAGGGVVYAGPVSELDSYLSECGEGFATYARKSQRTRCEGAVEALMCDLESIRYGQTTIRQHERCKLLFEKWAEMSSKDLGTVKTRPFPPLEKPRSIRACYFKILFSRSINEYHRDHTRIAVFMLYEFLVASLMLIVYVRNNTNVYLGLLGFVNAFFASLVYASDWMRPLIETIAQEQRVPSYAIMLAYIMVFSSALVVLPLTQLLTLITNYSLHFHKSSSPSNYVFSCLSIVSITISMSVFLTTCFKRGLEEKCVLSLLMSFMLFGVYTALKSDFLEKMMRLPQETSTGFGSNSGVDFLEHCNYYLSKLGTLLVVAAAFVFYFAIRRHRIRLLVSPKKEVPTI